MVPGRVPDPEGIPWSLDKHRAPVNGNIIVAITDADSPNNLLTVVAV